MPIHRDYEIRPVTAADEQQVAAMAQICADGRTRAYHLTPGGVEYTRGVDEQLSEGGLQELREQIDLAVKWPETHGFWVAQNREDKRLAGLCIARKMLQTSSSYTYMDRVFVAEADEGKGIATEFLQRIIDWSPGLAIQSEVVVGNKRALGVYEHLGFEVTGVQEPIDGFETELERLKIVRKAEEVAS